MQQTSAREELERGRRSYADSAWVDARESLSRADEHAPLAADDLELLATTAYMLGDEQGCRRALERAYHGHEEAQTLRRAARCAFWIGMQLALRGEMGPATGWLGRAQRLLDREDEECVEHGYMLMPVAIQHEAEGDWEGAAETAAAAAEIAGRFGDRDLFGLALLTHGEILVRNGDVKRGLALLDEAMAAVTAGELTPIPTGIVYCGVIVACEDVYELRRAREWTDALYSWCEAQPDMLAFTGDCHLHRGELLELHGAWTDALAELARAAERAQRAGNVRVAAGAAYHRGEIHRLRGEGSLAEAAYRDAAAGGREPQPGLALLRMAQGDAAAPVATIRRLRDEATDPADRARLLPACVEIMLAAGDVDGARDACAELEAIADERPSDLLTATAEHMRGAVALAGGEPRAALPHLRKALGAWYELDAPYDIARVRLLLADACEMLGDADSAQSELHAAREGFAALGVLPQIEAARDMHGLTGRELQVLRLVAAGQTNHAIADDLVLSERTVDRHVSNILAKLRVSSRAAATAYAYEHRLL